MATKKIKPKVPVVGSTTVKGKPPKKKSKGK
jgi:hypothetical protein